MILRLTVRDTRAGDAGRDVEITASANSGVGTLLDLLPVPVSGRPCFVGSAPLDPGVTLADSPLRQGSVISVGGPGPQFHPIPGGALGTLAVVSGVDAGLAVPLGIGVHTVSRDRQAGVRLRDADVSRRHARIEVGVGGRVVVRDVGSANGTFVDGVRIGGPTPLTDRSELRLGHDVLRWTPVAPGRARVTQGADGRLEFHRAFAAIPAVPGIEVDLPAEREVASNTIGKVTTFLAAIGSAAVGVALSHNPEMLWMGALGLLGPIGFTMAEDSQRTRFHREFVEAKDRARARIAAHLAEETRVRRALAPSPAEISAAAMATRPELWARGLGSPLGLALRVGVADQPASVALRGEPWPGLPTPTVHGVPVTVDLRAVGVLGVVGAAAPAQALVRWLIVQLATLHAPDELRMVLITADDGEGSAWMRWLPHLGMEAAAGAPCRIGNTGQTRAARIEELNRLIAARLAERGSTSDAWLGAETVVVLDGALALRRAPGMREILRDGPQVGVYALCVDRHAMTECRAVCDVEQDTVTLTRGHHDLPIAAAPEGITVATAERLARALAPMLDRAAPGDRREAIPCPVRLLDVLGLPAITPAAVRELWRRDPGPTTRVVLGADADGPVTVDLARQGPHTMLGGATGAGKSILLRTLITALLLANRPDELNLVLVDFKGGSAFLPFEHCPHVTALIRSTGESASDVFDDTAAARMLASIRAEVHRRESALARYDGEIDHYWRARRADPSLPPLPRLVLVFDEFARVLESTPEFLKELVNVAAKGRSLGMHLVLATQSLQGKLSPELKNNITLRISLRQNEPADSTEVLGVPDAAALPGTLRGRGMILCTTDEIRAPRPFQTGYLGDPPPSGHAAPTRVRALSWAEFGAPRPVPTTKPGGAATEQDLAVDAIVRASHEVDYGVPHRPLQPALPAELPLAELGAADSVGPSGIAATAVAFGLADEPEAQTRPSAFLDLAGPDQLLVAGGPQSGRTTFARTFISSLIQRCTPEQAHVYVFERRPSGLADFAGVAHCGGVFSPAEPDRVRRLITWLGEEVRQRAEQNPGHPRRPAIVLVIDGWEHFEDRADPTFAETSLTTKLREIIAAGSPHGVYVVAIGGQVMMSGGLSKLYNRRLLLPFPDEQTRRGYLSARAVSPPPLPGRAIDASTGRHVQICTPPRTPFARNENAGSTAVRFPPLPTRVTAEELPPPSGTWIPLGIGGTDLAAVGIDLFDSGPHLMLISGPPESGRSTAVLGMIRALRRAEVDVLAVAPPRSPLHRLLPEDPHVRTISGVTIDDTELREAVAGFGERRYAVLLDDAEQLTIQPTKQNYAEQPTLLDEIAQRTSLGRGALVLAADGTALLSAHRRSLSRIANEIMASGTRLLLTPAKREIARDHGFTTLERDQYLTAPPGRGYLAQGRETVLLQVSAD